MKIISKETELTIKALGAAMFMATVCLYMAVGFVLSHAVLDDFVFTLHFALLIQGILASLLASAGWVICIGLTKTGSFLVRYLLAVVLNLGVFAITLLIPGINLIEWYMLWLACGVFSTIAFGTGVAALSHRQLKKYGRETVLLWQLQNDTK